jgi:type IX secretion system PorP/SprF family membrane protein
MSSKLLKALLMLMLSMSIVRAQDIHFSQFYENGILRNPALTGIFSGDYKAGVNYRTQWSTISVPFQTMLASAETRILVGREVGDYLSIGVAATYDKAGTINFNSLQIYPALNYNKALADGRRSYLSVGFTGGYIQRSFDLSKATFSTQYQNGEFNQLASNGENIQNVNMNAYDLGAGVSFNSTLGAAKNINYYIGAAAFHVSRPKQTFAGDNDLLRLDTKFSGNLGVRASFENNIGATFHMNYTVQGVYKEIIAGGLASWSSNPEKAQALTLYVGMFVRFKDAIIPTVKMDFNQYSLTMSYDLNTSGLKRATNGMAGYELSLYIRGRYKHTSMSGAQVQCPRFEQMMNQDVDF